MTLYQLKQWNMIESSLTRRRKYCHWMVQSSWYIPFVNTDNISGALVLRHSIWGRIKSIKKAQNRYSWVLIKIKRKSSVRENNETWKQMMAIRNINEFKWTVIDSLCLLLQGHTLILDLKGSCAIYWNCSSWKVQWIWYRSKTGS